MAYDIRRSPKRARTPDAWLLSDLQKIESAVGSCFDGLGFLQRKATMLSIHLASKCVAGVLPNIELEDDGWRLSPDCSEAAPAANPVGAGTASLSPALVEPETTESLASQIKKSYERDYNSQRARVAVRARRREADDKYFVDDASDDESDVSPVLERFRERCRSQLVGV